MLEILGEYYISQRLFESVENLSESHWIKSLVPTYLLLLCEEKSDVDL